MRKRSQSFTVKGGSSHLLRLDAEKLPPPPNFFICPISLEVMQSPVSLCTGVTYDRSSIQRWLDDGNTTCPATMQPLISTDLVPNLTLRRLIHHWSSSSVSSSSSSSSSTTADATAFDDNLPPLSDITRFLSDPAANVADKLRLLSADSLRPSALASILSFSAPFHENLDHAVTLVSLLLSLDLVDGELKRALTATLLSNIDATVSALIAILKGSGVVRLPSRIAAARILEVVLSASSADSEARTLIAEKPYLMTELVRLIGECDEQAVDVGLHCLLGLISADSSAASPADRRVMSEFMKAGAMAELMRLLERKVAAPAVEMAMRAMEAAAGRAEGRAVICEEVERCVAAVVGRMMKVGNEGREAAVGVLWSVCYGGGGRDRRAREAVAAEKGGMAKILMVMQGECSPAGRRMAGDLLKIFSADARSSIDAAGYDTNTIHIMPY